MPKKLYPSEPAVFFEDLLAETREADADFVVATLDSIYAPWAQKLSDEHYPPQTQLPLD